MPQQRVVSHSDFIPKSITWKVGERVSLEWRNLKMQRLPQDDRIDQYIL